LLVRTEKWGLRHKCAVVWVLWDTEFIDNKEGYANEMAFALKDDMYAKENAHYALRLELAH
jgi:hypothetical protein